VVASPSIGRSRASFRAPAWPAAGVESEVRHDDARLRRDTSQFFGGRATRPWELLNLKIAKALGLTIRQSVLSQVDEVIQ
jgi:hypothetical protein